MGSRAAGGSAGAPPPPRVRVGETSDDGNHYDLVITLEYEDRHAAISVHHDGHPDTLVGNERTFVHNWLCHVYRTLRGLEDVFIEMRQDHGCGDWRDEDGAPDCCILMTHATYGDPQWPSFYVLVRPELADAWVENLRTAIQSIITDAVTK